MNFPHKRHHKLWLHGKERRHSRWLEFQNRKRRETVLKKRLQPNVLLQMMNMANLVAAVNSDDNNAQLDALVQFRYLLSIEKNPPIQEVIQAGVVPRFVEFLHLDHLPIMQFEAVWILSNITAGTSEQAKVVIDNGAVPILVNLLASTNDDVREQAVMALGNVSVDSSPCRDLILQSHEWAQLLHQLSEHSKLTILRNTTWTLMKLCQGDPPPSLDQLRPAIPVLKRLLLHSNDEEVLSNVCGACCYLCRGSHENIQTVIDSGVCGRVVELLAHPTSSVLTHAILTVGYIVHGSADQAQFILNAGPLPRLLSVLVSNHNNQVKGRVCRTIAGVSARNVAQKQAVIEAGLIAPLITLLQDEEFALKSDAAWAISMSVVDGTNEQIKYIADQGCIKPLCDLLTCSDPETVSVCLDSLDSILRAGNSEDDDNPYRQEIEEAEGFQKLENLMNHVDHSISRKASEMITTFWVEDDLPDYELPVLSGR